MRILRAMDQCGWSPFTTPELERRFTDPLEARVNNRRSDRADFTDEEHRQLRHLLELAGRITGAVIQPEDTSSGGPLFSDDGDDSPFETVFGPSIFGPVIDPPAPALPPTSVADSTAVPSADFQAQAETGTGAWEARSHRPSPAGRAAGAGSSTPRSRSTPPTSPPAPHVDIGAWTDDVRLCQVR
jgi:hypothetical protein